MLFAKPQKNERADQEDDDADQEHLLTAEHVAELADQCRRDRLGQQIRGDHPGQVVAAAEVPDDGGQCRRHDGLIQRGEQDAQQHGPENEVDAPPGVKGAGAALGAAEAGASVVAMAQPSGMDG